MGSRLGILAGLAVLTVGACGGPADSASSTNPQDRLGDFTPVDAAIAAVSDIAVPGRCLAGERLADEPSMLSAAIGRFGVGAYDALAEQPVWSDVVDCAKPHGIEIYAAVRLPDDVAEQVSSYADLLDPQSPISRAVDGAISHECAEGIGPAARVMKHSAIDVDIVPAISAEVGRLSWAPVPAQAWDDGDHAFGCLFEQPSPTATLVSDLSGGGLPDADRVCVSVTDFVSCAQPHDAEKIAVVTVDRAVARHQLTGSRAVRPSGQVVLAHGQWPALDRICERWLVLVSAHRFGGIRGVANTYPDFYPDADGHYTIVCSARSPFGTPVRDLAVTTHSVFSRS